MGGSLYVGGSSDSVPAKCSAAKTKVIASRPKEKQLKSEVFERLGPYKRKPRRTKL